MVNAQVASTYLLLTIDRKGGGGGGIIFRKLTPLHHLAPQKLFLLISLRGEFHIFKDPRGKDLQTHKQGWCKQRLAPCKTTLKSSPNSSMSRRHVYVKNILYYSYYLVKEKSNRCSNTILPPTIWSEWQSIRIHVKLKCLAELLNGGKDRHISRIPLSLSPSSKLAIQFKPINGAYFRNTTKNT